MKKHRGTFSVSDLVIMKTRISKWGFFYKYFFFKCDKKFEYSCFKFKIVLFYSFLEKLLIFACMFLVPGQYYKCGKNQQKKSWEDDRTLYWS